MFCPVKTLTRTSIFVCMCLGFFVLFCLFKLSSLPSHPVLMKYISDIEHRFHAEAEFLLIKSVSFTLHVMIEFNLLIFLTEH